MPPSIEAAGSTLPTMQKASQACIRPSGQGQPVAAVLGLNRGFERTLPEGLVDNLSRIVNDPSETWPVGTGHQDLLGGVTEGGHGGLQNHLGLSPCRYRNPGNLIGQNGFIQAAALHPPLAPPPRPDGCR